MVQMHNFQININVSQYVHTGEIYAACAKLSLLVFSSIFPSTCLFPILSLFSSAIVSLLMHFSLQLLLSFVTSGSSSSRSALVSHFLLNLHIQIIHSLSLTSESPLLYPLSLFLYPSHQRFKVKRVIKQQLCYTDGVGSKQRKQQYQFLLLLRAKTDSGLRLLAQLPISNLVIKISCLTKW